MADWIDALKEEVDAERRLRRTETLPNEEEEERTRTQLREIFEQLKREIFESVRQVDQRLYEGAEIVRCGFLEGEDEDSHFAVECKSARLVVRLNLPDAHIDCQLQTWLADRRKWAVAGVGEEDFYLFIEDGETILFEKNKIRRSRAALEDVAPRTLTALIREAEGVGAPPLKESSDEDAPPDSDSS